MSTIKVNFRNNPRLYTGRHIEIRLSGSQIRFYEVHGKKEYCLSKETIQALLRYGALAYLKVIKQALKGDKSIFDGEQKN
jgi:hypothetical protein